MMKMQISVAVVVLKRGSSLDLACNFTMQFTFLFGTEMVFGQSIHTSN
jgi:hypothetical protein